MRIEEVFTALFTIVVALGPPEQGGGLSGLSGGRFGAPTQVRHSSPLDRRRAARAARAVGAAGAPAGGSPGGPKGLPMGAHGPAGQAGMDAGGRTQQNLLGLPRLPPAPPRPAASRVGSAALGTPLRLKGAEPQSRSAATAIAKAPRNS